MANIPPEKIDVETDVEGLVAQIRIVINEILQDYGHIPIVRSLSNTILDLLSLIGKIIFCISILIFQIPISILFLIFFTLDITEIWEPSLMLLVRTIDIYDSNCPPSTPLNKLLSPLKSISNINRLYTSDTPTLTGLDECPCMQQ
jgi:hypothetical protein